jgi:glycosyltransferase involved in cell wall biosynthesis
MKKLGIFVGERGMWKFFTEIYEDLALHYETDVFTPKWVRLPFLTGRINNWAYRHAIRNILKDSDVSFFEWASEMLEVASHMPKYSPIITRLHSFELEEWANRINWDNVDKVIFVSDAIRKKFIVQYPAHAEKTVLVYNSISVKKFSSSQRSFDFSLGMLCSIQPIKRVYETILVVKELCDQGYHPSLHIAGAPSQNNLQDRYYVAVQGLVEKLCLQEVVKFYGNVDDPASWLQNIDIFISNSFWEGMQTALLEAMASGCYCLAHFWDGAEEALPSNNLYVTDSELKRKLIFYSQLSDEERHGYKMQMVEIARQKFDIEDKKIRFRNLIESVCSLAVMIGCVELIA